MTLQQSKLPLNLEDLLRARTVESDRIEYKAGWNPDAIVRTLYKEIPTIRAAMEENGSPAPRFSTDADRTYFLVELPVHPQLPGVFQAHEGAHDDLTETERQVLAFLRDQPRSRPEIGGFLGLKSRSGHLYRTIDHLRNLGLIELTIPDKPQSNNQKMKITKRGLAWLPQIK